MHYGKLGAFCQLSKHFGKLDSCYNAQATPSLAARLCSAANWMPQVGRSIYIVAASADTDSEAQPWVTRTDVKDVKRFGNLRPDALQSVRRHHDCRQRYSNFCKRPTSGGFQRELCMQVPARGAKRWC